MYCPDYSLDAGQTVESISSKPAGTEQSVVNEEIVVKGPYPMRCFFCPATDNLMTELEKHLKGNFLRKNVHCTYHGVGSFQSTQDIWDAHYATSS